MLVVALVDDDAVAQPGADAKDIARFLDGEITSDFGMSPGLVETAPTAEQLTAWWRNGHP